MGFKLSEVQTFVPIPSNYNPLDKQKIAEKIISTIKTRTRKGLDKNGRAFKYVKESEFEGDNLEQSGDMLLALEVISVDDAGVVIGYPSQDFEAEKAHGNITGSYGSETGNSKIAKDFLGISQKDLNLILAEYETVDTETEDTKTSIVNSIFNRLFGG